MNKCKGLRREIFPDGWAKIFGCALGVIFSTPLVLAGEVAPERCFENYDFELSMAPTSEGANLTSSPSFFEKDLADGFLDYLDHLVEQNLLRPEVYVDYQNFLLRLDGDGFIAIFGDIRQKLSRNARNIDAVTFAIQNQIVETYYSRMRALRNDVKKILSALDLRIERTRKSESSKKNAAERTEFAFRDLRFHTVKGGPYSNGLSSDDFTLPYDFEASETKLTQFQWATLMGSNPSKLPDDDGNIQEVIINGYTLRLQGDYPVQNITWYSALAAANALSEKMGLKPAYLFVPKYLDGLNGSAKEGNFWFTGLVQLNAPNGEISDVEGFRLPTKQESLYLRKGTLHANLPGAAEQFRNFSSEAEILASSWTADNSGRKFHEVATLAPLTIDGHMFYDLFGNGYEMSQDTDEIKFFTGVSGSSPFRDYSDQISAVKDIFRYSLYPVSRDRDSGVRFVRTIIKK